MRIYIPSRNRPTTLVERTLNQIPEPLRQYVHVVVPTPERDKYVFATKRWGTIVDICDAPGIAGTRFMIGQHAKADGKTKFVMMDDDLKFFKRKSVGVVNLMPLEPGDFEVMLGTMEVLLDDYAHVSISAREGNNHAGPGLHPLVRENTRALRVLAFRTDQFLACQHGRVDVMEDFDVQLQLLRMGYKNAVAFYYAHDQQMTGAYGGCSDYRTHSVQASSAAQLHALHPEFTSLRTKVNKTDREGFGTRTEVTVQWQKAWKSAGITRTP